jgi:hypothetical protein
MDDGHGPASKILDLATFATTDVYKRDSKRDSS